VSEEADILALDRYVDSKWSSKVIQLRAKRASIRWVGRQQQRANTSARAAPSSKRQCEAVYLLLDRANVEELQCARTTVFLDQVVEHKDMNGDLLGDGCVERMVERLHQQQPARSTQVGNEIDEHLQLEILIASDKEQSSRSAVGARRRTPMSQASKQPTFW